MTNIIFACFIFFYIVVSISGKTAPKTEGMFYQIYGQSLAVMDDVLISLKINKTFRKSKNNTGYMSAYNIVQDAIENNEREYEKMIEMTKIEICYKTAYFVSNINNIINEMISERNFTHATENFNKSNIRKDGDLTLLEFINLGKAFDIKINTFSDLELWDSELSRMSWNTRRLYDGNRTTIKRYPFIASIHVNNRFTCVGSIIREDLVITAASCLLQFISRKFDVANINVRVGSKYTNKFGKLVSVVDMRFHPLFNKTTLNHNLVILKLRKELKLNRQKAIAVHFDKETKNLPKDVDGVTILGWAEETTENRNKGTSEGDRQLAEAFVHLYNLEDCMNIYSRSYVTMENFCAGYFDKPTGACQNDIGGPAIIGSMLVGVVSFGSPRCGRSDAPTVFTKLGYYAGWIAKVFNTIPNSNKVSKKLKNENIINVSSGEIYDYSNEMADQSELYVMNKITLDIKAARQNPIPPNFYDSFDKIDTFETMKPQPIEQHPLIDKGIFLDPDLIDIPEFSDSDETSMLPPLSESTPDRFLPLNKEQVPMDLDLYKNILSHFLNRSLTTTSTATTMTTATAEPIVWPPEHFNLNASENAYDDWKLDAFKTTFLLPTIEATSEISTDISSPKAITRMLQMASSGESESNESNDVQVKFEYENPSSTNRANHKNSAKGKLSNGAEIIFLNSRSTKRYVFSQRDADVRNEIP